MPLEPTGPLASQIAMPSQQMAVLDEETPSLSGRRSLVLFLSGGVGPQMVIGSAQELGPAAIRFDPPRTSELEIYQLRQPEAAPEKNRVSLVTPQED